MLLIIFLIIQAVAEPQITTKILALDALHHSIHHAHLNLEEALALIEIIKPEQAYLIHISHRMGLAAEVNKTLPKGVELAYDGLEVIIK